MIIENPKFMLLPMVGFSPDASPDISNEQLPSLMDKASSGFGAINALTEAMHYVKDYGLSSIKNWLSADSGSDKSKIEKELGLSDIEVSSKKIMFPHMESDSEQDISIGRMAKAVQDFTNSSGDEPSKKAKSPFMK